MIKVQSYVCSYLGLRFCPTGLPICLILCQYYIVFFLKKNCIYFLLFCTVFHDSLSEIYWNTKRDETFNLCPFSLFPLILWCLISEGFAHRVTAIHPLVSCVSFIVLTFIFRLMIHCESTFIYEVKVQFHMSQWNHPVV